MINAWAMHLYCSDGATYDYPLPDNFRDVLTIDVSKDFDGNPEYPRPIDPIRLSDRDYVIIDGAMRLNELAPRGEFVTLRYIVDTNR